MLIYCFYIRGKGTNFSTKFQMNNHFFCPIHYFCIKNEQNGTIPFRWIEWRCSWYLVTHYFSSKSVLLSFLFTIFAFRMETDNSIESQIAYQDTIKAGHTWPALYPKWRGTKRQGRIAHHHADATVPHIVALLGFSFHTAKIVTFL